MVEQWHNREEFGGAGRLYRCRFIYWNGKDVMWVNKKALVHENLVINLFHKLYNRNQIINSFHDQLIWNLLKHKIEEGFIKIDEDRDYYKEYFHEK